MATGNRIKVTRRIPVHIADLWEARALWGALGTSHPGCACHQWAVQPPSTTRLVPVTSAAAGEAR